MSFRFRPGLLFVALLLICGACKKDTKATTEPAPVTTGTLKLKFDNNVDGQPLQFYTNYVNLKGDTFQVTQFKYYISNIVFTRADNTIYAEPNSYHLIRHSDTSSTWVTVGNIPPGTYKSVSLMLGIDSVRNVSGAQTGALDVAASGDMYWDWATGYVFFKLEGLSPQSGDPQHRLTYHLGGGAGPYKSQRTFNIGFNGALASVAVNGAAPIIKLSVNVNEFFKTPNLVDVSQPGYYDRTTPNSPYNKYFADNYADMISFENIRNF